MTVAIRGTRNCLGDSCTRGDSAIRAVRIAGGQAEVDPFFHQILSKDGCNHLKGPKPHLKTAAVPSPEYSAGTN